MICYKTINVAQYFLKRYVHLIRWWRFKAQFGSAAPPKQIRVK